MKDSKDFEMNRFVPDSLTTGNTVTTGDAQQRKRSVPTAKSESSELPAPTPSSGQVVKSRQTASTLPAEQSVPSHQTVSVQSDNPTQSIQPTQPQRTSSRQRKASLDEYREIFMTAPKITDRQPVFVSRETRDRIDQIVRRLGERKMSVSGFLENLARHHLELYAEDLEQVGKDRTWKIERKNLNFRTHLKRLCRRTICFSKSVEMHDKLIGLYIEKHYYKTGLYKNTAQLN